MVLSLKNMNLKKSSASSDMSADVVDGYLVLSLLNAQEPKIWRMALDKIGTATFELKTNEKDETTKLILKPKKGTAEIIAAFESKDAALEALTLASNAMRQKTPQTKAKNADTQTEKIQVVETANSSGKWGVLVLGFVAVIGLYFYLTTLMPKAAVELETTASQNQAIQNTGQPQTGVPLSADEFLNGL